MPGNKIFLFGLDFAGKTTLLSFLKGTPNPNPSPTKAFNVVQMIVNDSEFHIWDAPGQINYRSTWKENLRKSNILLFILDTSDLARFREAKDEFDKIINDSQLRGVPLIFCFHKMDIKTSDDNLKRAQDIFNLHNMKDRSVFPLATTIKSTKSINILKDIIVKLVINSQKIAFKARTKDFLSH